MCIISFICGGLGNQMFQYAAGRALAHKLGLPLKLDLSWFSNIAETETPRSFMLNAFPCRIDPATEKEIEQLSFVHQSSLRRLLRCSRRHAVRFVREPHYAYWPGIEQIAGPVYLLGYWQNANYFSHIESVVRDDFTFPPLPDATRALAAQIEKMDASVSVHIRRGDYITDYRTSQHHGVCSLDYYQRAISFIKQQSGTLPAIYVFSDDPAWARSHFESQGLVVVVVDSAVYANAPWNDMHLMSLCRHHILANSSFSWWGSWLSRNKGVTIAPKQWFTERSGIKDSPALPSWKVI